MSEDTAQKPKKRFKKRYFVLLLLAGLALWMKDYVVPSTWNYKVTVEIETPEGIKSGYAVRQMRNTIPDNLISWPQGGNTPDVVGEAVVIDIGEAGYLFAIMGTDPYRSFFKAFPVDGPTTASGIRYHRSLKNGTKAISGLKPQLVRFKDINDPGSVELVYGYEYNTEKAEWVLVDKLQDVLGTKAIVKNVSFEITSKKVTEKIGKVLPEVIAMNKGYLDGERLSGGTDIANQLHKGHFKRERK